MHNEIFGMAIGDHDDRVGIQQLQPLADAFHRYSDSGNPRPVVCRRNAE